MLCAATHGVLPDAKISQTPFPAVAPPPGPESPAMPPASLDPELVLVPELVPLPLVLAPLEPALAPLELALVLPPELALALPELVPLVLAPLKPPIALLEPALVVPPALVLALPDVVPLALEPPEPAVAFPPPALELPFVAPLFDAPGELSLEPLEQLPAAVTVMIAAPARDATRPKETTERDKTALAFAKFMHELYYVRVTGHASTGDATPSCSRTVKLTRLGLHATHPG